MWFLPAAGKSSTDGLYIAGGFIILFFIAGFFIIRKLRQNLTENRKSSDFEGFGLTLDQIDQMHQAGKISNEERTAMRKVIIGKKTGKEKVAVSDSQVDIIKETDESPLVELQAEDDDDEC